MGTKDIDTKLEAMLEQDTYLAPYRNTIRRRLEKIKATADRLSGGGQMCLTDVAAGHLYFGMHRQKDELIFREWAPHATAICLIGDFSRWREQSPYFLKRISSEGVWEIRLPADLLRHQDLYRLRVHWTGGSGDRIPAYARRVVQDAQTLIFNAQLWDPPEPFVWRRRQRAGTPPHPLIYEVHVGMAQAEPKIGSYREFTEKVLPRVIAAGYNTIQLMAIQEHPYYGSFGYQVSNFFAASSRFGTPDELKSLIDAAHRAGLAVVMDLVHSHAVANEVEGLSRFDGSPHQYFHGGPRGRHTAWDSRCFDYGKIEVLHFLLSNCRFWMDEYRVDGFRFDGITSMLYLDHGLGKAFTTYDDYFGTNVDEDALTYLALANQLIHTRRRDAITIAEDVSGMPGLAAPLSKGGIGFDYRFAMGVPDYWIKLTKDIRDEHWPMGHLWYELTNRRADEKTISYTESHDQALVGDQTLVFRMIGPDMYDHMRNDSRHLRVDRGLALHKMIRLITLATAGHGYLNFMGNEFGHPEWIDFPRPGNNWSYHYARRQWHLAFDPGLKYKCLALFDRAMIRLAKRRLLFETQNLQKLWESEDDKVLIFARSDTLFAFNFHPVRSVSDYRFNAPLGAYRMILNTDDPSFGGHGRLRPDQVHICTTENNGEEGIGCLSLYLPCRTAIVLSHSTGKRAKPHKHIA
jgi:1,4-alpha-glucan branching enzyme